ncbi:MAG: hypoxanthine phosphoribosyltransferase [Oligoflexia bacterium]|nr:hypoxanthine phosphoribosyltransferase [Oligoflexia bacterium]
MNLIDDKQFRPYLSTEQIDAVLDRLALQINQDYGVNDKILLVGVLKGAFIVMADLIRKLHSDVEIEFIRTASFGKSLDSAGTISILKDISVDVRNRHIVIVEEIIDSGRTLKFLYERLKSAKPLSLKIATLMDKKSKRLVDLNPDYVGIEVEDEFLVGFGLDLEEKCRNLPSIYALRYPN